MNLLVIGRGKTGSLVAEVARGHRHNVRAVGAEENHDGAALAANKLQEIDLVLDFTAPSCVIGHIEACARAGKSIVVGTTGWYAHLDQVRQLVESQGIGFLYAANFSIGVSIFVEVARAAAQALRHEYSGQIFERHHATKKDAPSGTAITLQRVIRETSGENENLEIISFREGAVVGMHELVLESAADRIYLCHDAKSRRGFAEGAVRAAEWLLGKKGFFDFSDVWREL